MGDDGADGTVGAELKKITAALDDKNGIQKLVADAVGAATAQAPATLNTKAKFGELTAAVEAANTAIDEKLESGDLTQLDISNLKALRSSINDIQSQLETAFKDLGLNVDDTANKVDPEKAKRLQEVLKNGVVASNTELGEKAVGVATSSQNQAETATSSKAKTEELFGKDGVSGTVGAELKKISDELGTGADKLAGKINAATAGQDLDFKAEYTKFKDAVEKSVQLIDDALGTNDLTELDTTNLKALRSSINEIKTTFDAALKESGLDETKANTAAKQEALDKLKAGLKPSEEVAKTATEKATATHKFSQNQPETVADIRESLR